MKRILSIVDVIYDVELRSEELKQFNSMYKSIGVHQLSKWGGFVCIEN